MTTMLLASWLVMPAAAYLLAMIAAWACIRSFLLRATVLSAMALLPLAIAISTAYRIHAVHSAEARFEALCGTEKFPAIHERTPKVDSVFLNIPRNVRWYAAARYAETAFPARVSAVLLLRGVDHYRAIEQIAPWGAYQRVGPDESRSTVIRMPSSWVSVEFENIRSISKYITTATFIVRDVDANRALAHKRTYVLDVPGVALLGSNESGLRVVRGYRRSCPSVRQLTAVVKTVASPAD